MQTVLNVMSFNELYDRFLRVSEEIGRNTKKREPLVQLTILATDSSLGFKRKFIFEIGDKLHSLIINDGVFYPEEQKMLSIEEARELYEHHANTPSTFINKEKGRML